MRGLPRTSYVANTVIIYMLHSVSILKLSIRRCQQREIPSQGYKRAFDPSSSSSCRGMIVCKTRQTPNILIYYHPLTTYPFNLVLPCYLSISFIVIVVQDRGTMDHMRLENKLASVTPLMFFLSRKEPIHQSTD